MVACDQGDDADVFLAEAKNLAIEDDVVGMFVVGACVDKVSALVKDGGAAQEQGVVGVELVEFGGSVEELLAQLGDLCCVGAVDAVLTGEAFGGA